MNDVNDDNGMEEIQRDDTHHDNTHQDNIQKEDDVEEIRICKIKKPIIRMAEVDVKSTKLDEIEKDKDNTAVMVVSSDGKKRKTSGKGILVGPYGKMNKEELIQKVKDLSDENKVLSKKLDTEQWTDEEVRNYQSIVLQNFKLEESQYMKYYNNNIQPKQYSIVQIENIIASIPMPLSYCRVSAAGSKFVGINHLPETITLLKELLPYHEFSHTNIYLNASQKLNGIQLKVYPKYFPKNVNYYYGVPGTTTFSGDFKNSEDKNLYSYAMKFSDCFKFLQPIYFKVSTNPADKLNNLKDVLNTYKGLFNVFIDSDYKFITELILDQIGYFFLNSGLVPDVKDFTLEILEDALPIPKLLDDLCYTDEEVEKLGLNNGIKTLLRYPRDYYTATKILKSKILEAIMQEKLTIGSTDIRVNGDSRTSTIKDDFNQMMLEDKQRHYTLLQDNKPDKRMIGFDNNPIPNGISGDDKNHEIDSNKITDNNAITKDGVMEDEEVVDDD